MDLISLCMFRRKGWFDGGCLKIRSNEGELKDLKMFHLEEKMLKGQVLLSL